MVLALLAPPTIMQRIDNNSMQNTTCKLHMNNEVEEVSIFHPTISNDLLFSSENIFSLCTFSTNVPYVFLGVDMSILIVLRDAFETVVFPRRVTRRIRLVRLFYRSAWRLWPAAALAYQRESNRKIC